MRLKDPLLKFSIVLSDLPIKIAGQSGNSIFITNIGITQSAGSQAAQMFSGSISRTDLPNILDV